MFYYGKQWYQIVFEFNNMHTQSVYYTRSRVFCC